LTAIKDREALLAFHDVTAGSVAPMITSRHGASPFMQANAWIPSTQK
jgi:hypothetical protein